MTAAIRPDTLTRLRRYSIAAGLAASAAIAVSFFSDVPRLGPAAKLIFLLTLGVAALLVLRRRPPAAQRAEALKAFARYAIIALFALRLAVLVWAVFRQP